MPLAPISPATFAQLDYVAVPKEWLHTVLMIKSDRKIALRTQHFALMVDLDVHIPKIEAKHVGKYDLSALNMPGIRQTFCATFLEAFHDSSSPLSVAVSPDTHRTTQFANKVNSALGEARLLAGFPYSGEAPMDQFTNIELH